MLYGESIFETLRTFQGEAVDLRLHLDRMAASWNKLLLSRKPLPKECFVSDVATVLAQCAGEGELYLRLMATPGAVQAAETPRRLVIAKPLDASYVDHSAMQIGFRPLLSATHCSDAQGAKVSSYLPNILAIRRGRAEGLDEVGFVNAEGQVIEGAFSNLFVIKKGVIFTPPLSAGALGGITRGYVFLIASHLRKACKERSLFPCDFYQADACFLTSALRGICRVERVDAYRLPAAAPGDLIWQLRQTYLQMHSRVSTPL